MAKITNYGGYATPDQALDEVIGRLAAALNPVAIYLFGSRALGTARPDSDFDLLVVTRPEDGEAGYDYARAYAPLAGLRNRMRCATGSRAGLSGRQGRSHQPVLRGCSSGQEGL